MNFLALRRAGTYLDRPCGLMVLVYGYGTEIYCVSCEVRTEFICYVQESTPPLWSSGQVPGYTTEMYCASCEVRTEFIYVM
jgi:hypothetical protein